MMIQRIIAATSTFTTILVIGKPRTEIASKRLKKESTYVLVKVSVWHPAAPVGLAVSRRFLRVPG